MVIFDERGNRSTRRKPLGAEKRTNKLAAKVCDGFGSRKISAMIFGRKHDSSIHRS